VARGAEADPRSAGYDADVIVRSSVLGPRLGPIAALACLGLAMAAVPELARADAPHVVWVASSPEGEVAGRARRWQRRVARALERAGAEVTTEPEVWAHEGDGSDE